MNSDETQAEIIFWPMAILTFILGVAALVSEWNIPILKDLPLLAHNLIGERWPLVIFIVLPTIYLPYLFYGRRLGFATLFSIAIAGVYYLAWSLLPTN